MDKKSKILRRLNIIALPVAVACASAAVYGQTDRTILPIPEKPFDGTIAPNALDSIPGSSNRITAPKGAPNFFVVMSDDVGFAMSSAFGGPVPTPNMERVAKRGQRFNRFHTTGICSPSRASLLTGRNHHNAGVGYLSDINTEYPGYKGRILRSTATIAQTLSLNGYSTAMFGKHHNTPTHERTEAGPFDNWPTGLGFDYFFGFISGDSDQYEPILYRGINRADMDEGKGKLLEARLADDMIRWVHNQNAGDPEKPFMIYFSPGSTHAPHQVPAEYIAPFQGQFDQGWDKERETIFKRQLAQGIVPRGTRLTARPEEIPAWNSLTAKQKAFGARSMEVAAAQLVFQDEQIGRLLDELERMGELDNTLVVIINGDNGASAEAGPKGTLNEMRTMGVHDETDEWLYANIDKLGGPDSYASYPAGWAWAMATPLRWTKQVASMFGGTRNGMIMSWGDKASEPGSVCPQFTHLIDITPTLLAAAQLPVPESVLGTAQKPIDGEDLLPSMVQCDSEKPRTQYFEIGGKIGLYYNGWFLSGDDGRVPWENLPPGGTRPQIDWTLYDLSTDFSQARDLSAQVPERVAMMIDLWKREAARNNVYPIDHRFAIARAGDRGKTVGTIGPSATHFDYWGKDVSVAAHSAPMLMLRSYTVTATIKRARADASGVILAVGSQFGGWSLFLDKGRLNYVWARSMHPDEIQTIRSEKVLPDNVSTVVLKFKTNKPGAPATVSLWADNVHYGSVILPRNYLIVAGGGETLDIGRDLGVAVTDYPTHRGEFEGDIPHIAIDFD